jgi:hypothetical protein
MFCDINMKESESRDAAVTLWFCIREEDSWVRISTGILTKIFQYFPQSNDVIVNSFNDAVISSNATVSNDRIFKEQLIGENFEGSGRGQFAISIPDLGWRY